jgi:endo-1,4-beta-xylanase
MGHYKGKIFAWDVVNEAIDTFEEDNYRKTVWYEALGPEYIEQAFRFARNADPDAQLFLNDYSTYDRLKGDAIYALAKDLKEKGVPIDGIGMQLHIGIQYPALSELERTFQKFRKLGLKIHITELDMTLSRHEGESFDAVPRDLLVRQGYRYKEIFDLFKANSDIIENVTFWGFNDGHTWLTSYPFEKKDWPLLFDDRFKAKYAYWGLVDSQMLPEDIDPFADLPAARIGTAEKGSPVIDGYAEDLWSESQVLNIETFAYGEKGATGSARLLWDKDRLYIFAEILDSLLSGLSPNVYEQDSLEVFLDENNGKTMAFEEDDQQFRINYKNKKSYGGYATAIESKTVLTDRGYNVEAAITFLQEKGEAGKTFGFDLQINDDLGGGTRDAISKWNDSTNESWRNTMGWGIIKLND